MKRNKILALAVAAAVLCGAPLDKAISQPADARVDEIKIGMSTALTGPAAQLGLNMRAGVLAAFDEANRSGGIHGRHLRLISLDDGYEPSRTAPNMHQLIDEHEVLAVIGNVGTPTAVAAIPIANARKTALFGAFTGGGRVAQNAARSVRHQLPRELCGGDRGHGRRPGE